jgi:hypothetical protein
MWQRLLIIFIFFASLLPTSVHAQSSTAQIQLTNRYAANELVRVIVSLRSAYERKAVAVSPAQLATRQRAITRHVSAFRERNRAMFHTVHREFSVFPTIAVTVLRRDIERLAMLPDVVRIVEDIARPAVLDESGELIHSRAVIEGGYAGAGSTVPKPVFRARRTMGSGRRCARAGRRSKPAPARPHPVRYCATTGLTLLASLRASNCASIVRPTTKCRCLVSPQKPRLSPYRCFRK